MAPKKSKGKNGFDRQVELRTIDSLVSYGRNARTHSDWQIQQIMASLQEFGCTNPVLINDKSGIIAGHARVEAAKRMGLVVSPVLDFRACPRHRNGLMSLLTINWHSMRGGTKRPLDMELADLKELNFNLDLTGVDAWEVAALMAKFEMGGGLTDPDEVSEVPEKAVTVSGDLWLLGKNRLLGGDST